MNNFSFQNTTRIHFGEGQIAAVAGDIPKDKKVLVTYGGGSIKKNGVYDQVAEALKDHAWGEFGGIDERPRGQHQLVTLHSAQCRQHMRKDLRAARIAGGGIDEAFSGFDGKERPAPLVRPFPYEGTDVADTLRQVGERTE